MGAERIGSILNLSFVKLLKRGYAQRELMNPNDVYDTPIPKPDLNTFVE
jgi:hypothetical protein